VIDQSYEALDEWARSKRHAQAEPGHHESVSVPSVGGVPAACVTTENLAQQLQGRHVRLVHPWDLIDVTDTADNKAGADAVLDVAWLCPAFHAALPWSYARWDWAQARMTQMTPLMVVGDAQTLQTQLAGAASVQVQLTKNAAYKTAIEQLNHSMPHLQTTLEPALLPPIDRLCNSFTKFYQTAQKLAGRLESCL
jgi:hypothetical protein